MKSALAKAIIMMIITMKNFQVSADIATPLIRSMKNLKNG
jgi:hypothetical protein